MDDPWDELMGPPTTGGTGSQSSPSSQDPPAVRSGLAAPPPAALFRSDPSSHRSNSSNNGPPLAAFAAAAPPPGRWSHHEADPAASRAATAQAVYMASNAALRRAESSGGGSSSAPSRSGSVFEDDDMVDTISPGPFEIDSVGSDRNHHHNHNNSSTIESDDDDDDHRSVDSDIGREYDARNHDQIRQEALRMLEVADADEHYSVHRTITGGFTAHAKPLGHQKRTKKALQALNHIAHRTHNAGRRSYAPEFGGGGGGTMSAPTREDFEYGDHHQYDNNPVVDVIGLEARSASAVASGQGSGGGSSWSSRYSIDKTMLAMSGGAMKQSLDRMDREHNVRSATERFSAANLFGSSPVRSPQIFGSGFAFRQQHVFGKQNVVMPTDNIHSTWNDGAASSSNGRAKTWQEQLVHKRQQQRRWLVYVCFGLLCFIVPFVAIMNAHHRKNSHHDLSSTSANDNSLNNSNGNNITDSTSTSTTTSTSTSDGNPKNVTFAIPAVGGADGSVTFFVTANTPNTLADERKLTRDLAAVTSTASFAVHLGNIQNANVTHCATSAYSNVSELLVKHSPITVFTVPGEEDWNNCPDPTAARDTWDRYFRFFYRKWEKATSAQHFTVTPQRGQLENWSFLNEGVLFIGVHVVNGIVPDQNEFDRRNDHSFRWISELYSTRYDEFGSVVIFGNAQPGSASNNLFFGPLQEFAGDLDKPCLYVHASSLDGLSSVYQPFQDAPMFHAAGIETDLNNPPVRIIVGSGDVPFLLA